MMHDRFIQIIEAYGADPARWPEAEREQAELYAAAHPELTDTVLADESALDALLVPGVSQPLLAASDLLERRIMRGFPPPVSVWGIRAPVAAAAALVLGVAIGFGSGAITGSQTTDEYTVYADAFSGLDEDWVDWLGSET